MSESEATPEEVEAPEAGGESEPQEQAATPEYASREDIAALANAVSTLYQQQQQLLNPPQQEQGLSEEDLEGMDMTELMQLYVDGRLQGELGQIMPYVQTAAQQAGEQRLQGLFSEAEKQIGPFDKELAAQLSDAMFRPTGEPHRDAEIAVHVAYQAAQRAKQIQDEYSKKAVEDYKASLKQPYDLPAAAGGAQTARPKFKTTADVLDWYEKLEEH